MTRPSDSDVEVTPGDDAGPVCACCSARCCSWRRRAAGVRGITRPSDSEVEVAPGDDALSDDGKDGGSSRTLRRLIALAATAAYEAPGGAAGDGDGDDGACDGVDNLPVISSPRRASLAT